MTFMNIVKLNGEDTELYRRVAHLVMNREVLASNNNYPFKTSSEHIWFSPATTKAAPSDSSPWCSETGRRR